ncbi:regulation of nuclear pre-mRNA domain-containing protein 2 isoform X2 [Ixodes scapularis]|uniref:regulation of nuclear pre-mRNA domain-containing protein 2 isoform X2 n=1 Tax=Ixodes scapularis TaxID=6945 RepID=UPI001A9D7C39|nr:regulation of nuclear pre-mRNA domain-containing protein 2 isoform X2 [Ixodes scapularis]
MALNEPNLVKKLTSVTNTQDSVQTLALWIIHHRAHHRKIVDIWAKVLKKSKPSHRLTMLYLANDVLQNGRRKGVQQYIESFGEVLPHQVPLFRDEKILKQVDRVFTIWSERSVYPSDFTLGLKDILHKRTGEKLQQHHHHHHHHHHSSTGDGAQPAKEPSRKDSGKLKTPEVEKIILEFKPEKVIEKIKKLKKVENDSVIKLAALTSRNMDVSSSEVLRKFKDRSHGQQFQKDFEDATRCLEEYIKALEREMAERTEMTEMLEEAKVYYDSQHGEARIVATAYKNFGSRVKGLKRKLEAKMKTLPSPVPSPTPDAPSPTNSDDDALLLPPPQDTESSLAPPLAEPVVVDNGEARAVMGLDGCSPQSAPSPEGSPVGLSPVLPGNGATNDVSGGPDGAEGGASALSSFMSQSPSLISSWLDAFNQEFQESKAADTLGASLSGNTLLSVPSPLAAAVPSTLESRLSSLMQNMSHLPSGLFSSTSSASNTPKGQDSPLPYATAVQPSRTIPPEPHSTPLKDENSGQGTPVLDENLAGNSAKHPAKKTAPVADTDLRIHPPTGSKTDSSESTPTQFGSAAFGSKIPTLGSPASWLPEGSPKTSAPALAPPPIPPALQAYLEPIRTVTTTGAEEVGADLLPSPSADYLIPVAENFDVTDMELDDSGDEGDGMSHRKKAATAAAALAAASNLITLVQPDNAATRTAKEESLEKPREEPKSTTPASTLASTSSPALSSGMAMGAAAMTAQGDSRHLRQLAEGGGYPSSPLTQPSKIETVQTRAIERSPPPDDVNIWERRDYYDVLSRSQQPPPPQHPQMSNGGNRMQGRGGYYGYEMRPQPPPEHFRDDYDGYGRGYEPDWQGLPPSPRYRHFSNNGPPPPQQRPPYFHPRY